MDLDHQPPPAEVGTQRRSGAGVAPAPTGAAVAGAARAVLRHAAAIVVPPACVGCRRALASADALALCPECLRALRWIGPDGCRRCGLPAHGGRPCPARDAPWSTAWAPVAYAGPAAALVRALKFRGALPLLDLMAAQIATNLPPWSLPANPPRSAHGAPGAPSAVTARRPTRGPCVVHSAVAAAPGVSAVAAVVVPVPPVGARRRRRGFDAADGLAVRVAERLGLPVARPLERHGGARQLGATRAQRRAEGKIDVRLRAGVAPPAGAVLLVDDVHTTGSTLRACASVLHAAGSGPIHVATYARTT